MGSLFRLKYNTFKEIKKKGSDFVEDLETKVQKRIDNMNFNLFCDVIDKLQVYGVNLYNGLGEWDFGQFRNDCKKTFNLLFKNDEPRPETGIKYQLCDFMSAVQAIVGIRNITEFMYR